MTIPVSIALVCDRDCYVVGLRGSGSPLAGYFEFPGGKCEPDETVEQCAVRECFEETGLSVRVVRLRELVEHRYPHGLMRLHFFDCALVDNSDGEPLKSNFRWVPRSELGNYRFPEPNQAILEGL